MSNNTDLFFDVKKKMLAKYPRFGSEIATTNIEFKDNLPCSTAATDGKNIYVDPNFFKSLNENDKLFVIAHEIMHIKFIHMFRLIDKNGKMRDMQLWNIATDAIINANLERDGFTIKKGYVNMPEAIQYSAEEFYQKLLEEKEQNKKKNKQSQQKENQEQEQQQEGESQGQEEQQEGESQEQGQQGEEGQEQKQSEQKSNNYGGDHSLWEEAFKQQQNDSKKEKEKQEQQRENKKEEKEQTEEEQTEINFDEKGEFEDNREEKREKFESRREKTEKNIRNTVEEKIKLENIGKSKEEIDWKVLIRREIEKTETIWSQRRSIAENNYAYRLEENDIEDDAETEVMIDVSGSVELGLVKAFLRQIKPLLKQSKLRVGCFNEKFWGFVDIKSVKDIDNFTIPREARGMYSWTEDWDLAVRSFTKKREINKIVFTDGYPCPGTMPKDDLKKENVIWLVYGNEKFRPCCGKVINITEKQLEQLYLIEKNSSMDDISR